MTNMNKLSNGERIWSIEELLKQAMPPRLDFMAKLEKAVRDWESVVGQVIGRQSVPLDIVGGELLIAAKSPLVGSRLTMMGGNIIKALAERWGLEVTKVKIVVGSLPLKVTGAGAGKPRTAPLVRVKEEDVKEFSSRCIENLPDFPPEAAESLARLRAFFIKRFKQG